VLVLKKQLGFSAPITRIEYHSAGTYSNVEFYNLEFRVCHTSLAELTANFSDNYDGKTPVLVATADPLTVNVGLNDWFGFDLSPKFNYNGSDNLIVEVRWQNQATGDKVNTWAHDTGKGRMLKTREYNGSSGGLVPTVNQFRITYDSPAVEPTSLGRVRALYR
jgi:hypothetical protein